LKLLFVWDLECTHHMIPVSSLLNNKRDYKGVVNIANGQQMQINVVGRLYVRCLATKRWRSIEDVYVVPKIVCALPSVKALCRK
jgi:hypothetical protein